MPVGDARDAGGGALQAVRDLFGGACLLLLGLGLWWAWLGALVTRPVIILPLAVAGTILAGLAGGWAIRSPFALIVPLGGVVLQAWILLLMSGLAADEPSWVEWALALPLIAVPWGVLGLAAWAGWHAALRRRPSDVPE